MTLHRFFIAPDLIEGDQILFPSDLAHQLSRVLRLRVGDRVLVLDGSGDEREVALHTLERRTARGTVVATRPNVNEPRTHLTLYVALLKARKLDLVLQKGTEIGVSRFVPILTDRAIVGSLNELSDAKMDRWEAIVREAAEQSERARLPEVVEPMLFDVALGQSRSDRSRTLIAWEEGGDSLRSALSGQPSALSLYIGPEGGFTADEVLAAQAYGAQVVSLGPRILRAETAMIAAATMALYELGDLE